MTADYDALWVTSWQEHVLHAWAPCWQNALFRNESEHLASELITEAVAATRAHWPHEPVPEYGMITFVDADAVRSSNPGYCYQHAGFAKVGVTNPERGHGRPSLLVYQLTPEAMPESELAHGMTYDLLGDL